MINNTNRYVTHFQGDASRPPVGLAEHIAWLEGQLAGIPAEYRASAEVEYEAPESCEQSNGWLYIRYQRPETPEECAERLSALRARNKARAAAREAYELWEKRMAAQQRDTALLLSQPILDLRAGGVTFHSTPAPKNPAK